jgi:hypothetical protein
MRTVTPERAAQMIARIVTGSSDPNVHAILQKLKRDIATELDRQLRQPKTKTR